MSNQREKFSYTYSASLQEEIDIIRNKYLPEKTQNEVNKMDQLRRLDASVTKKAIVPSLTAGILGALIMGMGMSLIMTDIGAKLGISATLLPGILLGLTGITGVIFAYPLYHFITKRQRRKIAPQILKLTEELTQT